MTVQILYGPCPCGSGKKYKFCCLKNGSSVPSVAEIAMARAHPPEFRDEGAGAEGPEWFESPFALALINQDWRPMGLASLFVGRLAEKRIYAHSYLIDLHGLGMKDCYRMRPFSEEEFRNTISRQQPFQEIDKESARQLVWGGIHFAHNNGFRPPNCFATCARAVGPDPGPSAALPPRFGYQGSVHIVGEWEDLSRRSVLSHPSVADAMAHWTNRGYKCTIGFKNQSPDLLLEMDP